MRSKERNNDAPPPPAPRARGRYIYVCEGDEEGERKSGLVRKGYIREAVRGAHEDSVRSVRAAKTFPSLYRPSSTHIDRRVYVVRG